MRVVRLDLTIPGEPVPKARPRADGRGKKPRIYTPTETINYEKKVKLAATGALLLLAPSLAEPWPMRATAYLVVTDIYVGERDPDGDNVFKSVVDGMIGALYYDDKRVGGYFPPPRIDARPRVDVSVVAFVGENVEETVEIHAQRLAILTHAKRAIATAGRASNDTELELLGTMLDRWRARR